MNRRPPVFCIILAVAIFLVITSHLSQSRRPGVGASRFSSDSALSSYPLNRFLQAQLQHHRSSTGRSRGGDADTDPSIEAVYRGEWQLKPSDRWESFDDIHRWFGDGPSVDGLGCWVAKRGDVDWDHFGPDGNRSIKDVRPTSVAGRKRLEEIMKWEWKPQEVQLRKWDEESFVGRLLNSRAGLVLSGDSLTFHWFQVLLHRFTAESSSLPPLAIKSEPILRVHQLTLNPAHPFFNILRKRYPYIPLSRFSQPFITFAMADHLFDYDLIATMLEDDFGFQPGWRPDFEGEPRTSDWLSVIKERTDMKGWRSEEDSIIVLNTGAHWTAKPIGFREDLDLLLPIYRRMLEVGLPPVLLLPRTQVLWRSTGAAPQSCHLYLEPVSRERTIGRPMEFDDPKISDHYGWKRFQLFNELAVDVVENFQIAARLQGRIPNIHYMNTWLLDLQRPEAKALAAQGITDCQHWCLPGVPWTWWHVFWHHMEAL